MPLDIFILGEGMLRMTPCFNTHLVHISVQDQTQAYCIETGLSIAWLFILPCINTKLAAKPSRWCWYNIQCSIKTSLKGTSTDVINVGRWTKRHQYFQPVSLCAPPQGSRLVKLHCKRGKKSLFFMELVPVCYSGDSDDWNHKLCFSLWTWLDVASAAGRGRGGNRVIPVISGF